MNPYYSFLQKMIIAIGAIMIFFKFREQDGFWYLYECPSCNRRRLYKKWINDPDPACQTCQIALNRVL